MGRFFDAVKAGVAGIQEGMGPRAFVAAGRPITCAHCGETKFILGRALLNRRGTTMFNLDWTDPGAATLVCADCGRIEWFAQEPDEAPLHQE